MQRRNSDSTQNVFGEDNKSTSEESGSSLDSEETAGYKTTYPDPKEE